MAKQHAKTTDENPLDITRRMLSDGLMQLEGQIDSGGVGTPADFAHLLTKVAQIQAELRKADAEERRRGEALSAAVVLEWFRALQPAERTTLLREMEHVNQKRSGLA